MCDSGGRPGFGGMRIASLRPGDEIIIQAGFSVPAKEENVTDIVIFADEFLAITASGIKLYRRHGYSVKKTGNHFEEGTYEVAPEAEELMRTETALLALLRASTSF